MMVITEEFVIKELLCGHFEHSSMSGNTWLNHKMYDGVQGNQICAIVDSLDRRDIVHTWSSGYAAYSGELTSKGKKLANATP